MPTVKPAAEIADFTAHLEAGMKPAAAAEAVGWHPNTGRNYARRMGIVLSRKKRGRKPGRKPAQIVQAQAMPGNRISPEQWNTFLIALRDGHSIKVATERARISYNSGVNYLKKLKAKGQDPIGERKIKPVPLNWTTLCDEAKRAYDDFVYFRLRYMGHPSEPWEVETADRIIAALATDHREFMVENCPPGVGKTTLLHDIAAWITVRNRAIRGVFGSKNASNARRMMRRLRRTLERTRPVTARAEDKLHGMAFDAVATLAGDYGLFRPVASTFAEKDVWNNDEFVVVQADDTPIDEKESTWTAFGIKSDILSMRYDVMLCDDMDDSTTVGTIDQVETQRRKWDNEVETRLEPRGVAMLVEQRIDPNDLSRYNLDKRIPLDPEEFDDLADDQLDTVATETPSMYQHIVYKAHDESRCQGKITHRFDAPAWPAGCLLSPKRLPWRDVYRIKVSKPRVYAVEYQQEDMEPEQTLVKKSWMYGGVDIDEETGIRFDAPGCIDKTRNLCELPEGISGRLVSIATIDPSPSRFWAIQWWVYAPEPFNQIFLMDSIKRRMSSNELLQYDPDQQKFVGIMEEWQDRSKVLGFKIEHWIIEVNAAQKFMLESDLHERWRWRAETNFVKHTTGINKLDPKLGVPMIREWFKYGRVRLPFADAAKFTSMHLIEEACRYRLGAESQNGADDQVMAMWFMFHNLPALSVPPSIDEYQARPSYAASLDARRYLQAVG